MQLIPKLPAFSEAAFAFLPVLSSAPLDDETAVLNKRLIFVQGNSFHAGNCGFGNGKFGPVVTRNQGAGGEGHEVVVSASVSSGGESNSTSAACA